MVQKLLADDAHILQDLRQLSEIVLCLYVLSESPFARIALEGNSREFCIISSLPNNSLSPF